MLKYSEIKDKTFIIAGPCVIESMEVLETVAKELVSIKQKYNVEVVFKASFDKANRTSIDSYRGVGIEKGLEMLKQIKEKYNLPLCTDIHESYQAEKVKDIIDIIQIPAFLCRQTDLLVAAAKTGRIINIKKGQFLSGEDMFFPVKKVSDSGNNNILLTERGNSFGYNNLIVDFRNIPIMKEFGYPVIMDCTHSVQRPNAGNGTTGGNREYVPYMAMAAKSFGANAYFFEIHPNPDQALSDGPNTLHLFDFDELVGRLV